MSDTAQVTLLRGPALPDHPFKPEPFRRAWRRAHSLADLHGDAVVATDAQAGEITKITVDARPYYNRKQAPAAPTSTLHLRQMEQPANPQYCCQICGRGFDTNNCHCDVKQENA